MKSTKHIIFYFVNKNKQEIDDFYKYFSYDRSYTIYDYTSVQQFIDKLSSNRTRYFSIVIIDDIITSRGLNTKSAQEVLPTIKNNIDKNIPVIILTEKDNKELHATSSDVKASAFIKKDKQLYVRLLPTINRVISEYEVKSKRVYARIACGVCGAIFILIATFFIISDFLL